MLKLSDLRQFDSIFDNACPLFNYAVEIGDSPLVNMQETRGVVRD